MDILKQDIEEWIVQFVCVYNNELDAIPCPFAKQAMITNKIFYIEFVPEYEHITNCDHLIAICENHTYHWPEGIEVIIIGFNPTIISAEELNLVTNKVNDKFARKRGYIVLEDHPDEEENINGASMNQGKWALLFIQSEDKLNKASSLLKKQGYYNSWPKEAMDNIVNWRVEDE